MRGSLGSFEYHTFLHHSQTMRDLAIECLQFEYHTFLHHSQTLKFHSTHCSLFEYHTFLHHSQTHDDILSVKF